MFPHAALTQPIRVNMEDQDAAPMPLYMFWEPFLGSRLDIWDVWTPSGCNSDCADFSRHPDTGPDLWPDLPET